MSRQRLAALFGDKATSADDTRRRSFGSRFGAPSEPAVSRQHSRSECDLRRAAKKPFDPYDDSDSDEDSAGPAGYLPPLRDEDDAATVAVTLSSSSSSSKTASKETDEDEEEEEEEEDTQSTQVSDEPSAGRGKRSREAASPELLWRSSSGQLRSSSSSSSSFASAIHKTYSGYWGLSRCDSAALTNSQTMTPPRSPDSPHRPKQVPEPPEKRHRPRFAAPPLPPPPSDATTTIRIGEASHAAASAASTATATKAAAVHNRQVPPSFVNPFYVAPVTAPPLAKKGAEPLDPSGAVPRLIADFVVAHSSITTVGEHSRVTFVKHRLDGIPYAVKTKLGSEAPIREQLREVHALAALGRHPNIVGYYSSWIDDSGCLSIQMEYCCGTLEKDVAARLVYSPAEFASAARDLLAALRHVHAHQLLHLDVKPENIFYVRSPARKQFKLGDFGLVKKADDVDFGDEGDGRYYRLDHGEKPTAAHDLQALGISLNEIVVSPPLDDLVAPLVLRWLHGSVADQLRAVDILRLLSTDDNNETYCLI